MRCHEDQTRLGKPLFTAWTPTWGRWLTPRPAVLGALGLQMQEQLGAWRAGGEPKQSALDNLGKQISFEMAVQLCRGTEAE